MKSKISNIILNNVQSWGEGVSIKLTPSNILIMRAQSEVGKSVLCKFIIALCTYDSPSEWEKIIRDGCERAEVLFIYEDGAKVLFQLSKTYKRIIEVNVDGTRKIIEQYQMDEKILQRYGFLVDLQNKIVLNIYSRKIPLLFIDTTVSLNGRVLDRILLNQDLEDLLIKIRDRKDTISSRIDKNNIILSHKKRLTELYKFKDTKVLQQSLQRIREIKPEIILLDSLNIDIQKAKSLKLPKNINIDLDDVNEITQKINSIDCILDMIVKVKSKSSSMPKEYVTDFSFDKFLSVNKTFITVQRNKNLLLKSYSDLKDIEKNILKLENDLKLEIELSKICPTCGRPYDENYSDCNN